MFYTVAPFFSFLPLFYTYERASQNQYLLSALSSSTMLLKTEGGTFRPLPQKIKKPAIIPPQVIYLEKSPIFITNWTFFYNLNS